MDSKNLNITHALVREISRSIGQCQLLHVPRLEFDLDLARRQHAAYVAALAAAGVKVTVLPEQPAFPDASFVEDTVIMLDEVAVLCLPGAASRVGEIASIAEELAQIRPLHRIVPPGTLEGGNVLHMGKTLYVGLSSRTNGEGIRQLTAILAPFGYETIAVTASGCLHLKSAVTSPGAGLVLANPDWMDLAPFARYEILRVPEEEPWAANTLALNGLVFAADSFPRTAALLESKGLRVQPLAISEMQKAEAALTCLSVLYTAPDPT